MSICMKTALLEGKLQPTIYSFDSMFAMCSLNESVPRSPFSFSILRKYDERRNVYPTMTSTSPDAMKK